VYELAEFLEPRVFSTWLLRSLLSIVGSYVVVWFLACVLCRLRMLGRDDTMLRVHVGWLIPLTLHCLAWTVIELFVAMSYVELDISLWYAVIFLVPVIASAVLGSEHGHGALQRLGKRAKRLAKEVGK